MVKRNYLKMIDNVNDGFGDNGWADGYADFPSDHDELIGQLYNKVERQDFAWYLTQYLEGYELGQYMSEEADNIYDEDGCLKEEINLDTCPQEYYAKHLILNYMSKK